MLFKPKNHLKKQMLLNPLVVSKLLGLNQLHFEEIIDEILSDGSALIYTDKINFFSLNKSDLVFDAEDEETVCDEHCRCINCVSEQEEANETSKDMA